MIFWSEIFISQAKCAILRIITTFSSASVNYNLYLNLGVQGLRSLKNYIVEDNVSRPCPPYHPEILIPLKKRNGVKPTTLPWSAPSSPAPHFMTITHHPSSDTLTVHIDRSKILSHGRPAIGLLLLILHIYRSTAQVDKCKEFYEELTRVDGFS